MFDPAAAAAPGWGAGFMRFQPFPGFEHLPEIQQPHVVAEELFSVIRNEITGHARSNQKAIGPSEIGHPCPRWLIHRLEGHREGRDGIPWKATVGTAIHSWLERTFEADNIARAQHGFGDRWLIENRLKVGTLLGTDLVSGGDQPDDASDDEISGSCDIFDAETATVWDWKTSTLPLIRGYQLHGIKPQYRTQAHLYGRGWELLGRRPLSVGNVYLLRNGELKQSWVWCEPYDHQVALDAIARLEGLELQRQLIGWEAALKLYPLCEEQFCMWCKAEKPYVPRPTAALFTRKP